MAESAAAQRLLAAGWVRVAPERAEECEFEPLTPGATGLCMRRGRWVKNERVCVRPMCWQHALYSQSEINQWRCGNG